MEIVVGKKGTKLSGETDFGEHSVRIGKLLRHHLAFGQRNHFCGPARFAVTLRNRRVGPSVAGRDRKGMDIDPPMCRVTSRTNSMRPRTLNLESSDETWNFTVRSERFREAAISLLAKLRMIPESTSSSRRVTLMWLLTEWPAWRSLSAFSVKPFRAPLSADTITT